MSLRTAAVVAQAVAVPTLNQGQGGSVEQGQRRTLGHDRGPGLRDRRRVVGHVTGEIRESGLGWHGKQAVADLDGGRGGPARAVVSFAGMLGYSGSLMTIPSAAPPAPRRSGG